METFIKEHLEKQGVLPRTIGMNLLAECISFWMDTDFDELIQITKCSNPYQKYNSNLYVDLAILHDGSIHTVMHHMWSSLPGKEGTPLNPTLLNYFIMQSILRVQKEVKIKEEETVSAQIIPFPNQSKPKVKKRIYQEVYEKEQ